MLITNPLKADQYLNISMFKYGRHLKNGDLSTFFQHQGLYLKGGLRRFF